MMYDTLHANTEMYKRMLRQSLHYSFKIQYATLKQHEKKVNSVNKQLIHPVM